MNFVIQPIVELRIGQHVSSLDFTLCAASGSHSKDGSGIPADPGAPGHFGRFAPYFDRP
jgi:hypothetical protein